MSDGPAIDRCCFSGMSSLERRATARRQASAQAPAGLGNPFFLDQHKRLFDRALVDFAIYSKLCGCDVVKVRISEIV